MINTRIAIVFAALAASSVLFAASKPVKVELKDAKGMSVGTATITENKGGMGVTVKTDFKNLPPGEHALHFHAVAKCEAPFTTAGGHFNPDNKKHGTMNPDGAHAGDMPNFVANPKGIAKASITDPRVNLGTDSHSLFSNGGTAIMIHAKGDDMKTDPAGAAGDRIACGVITK